MRSLPFSIDCAVSCALELLRFGRRQVSPENETECVSAVVLVHVHSGAPLPHSAMFHPNSRAAFVGAAWWLF